MNRRRTVAPRSTRTLAEACALAGLPEPGSAKELGQTYLLLLIQGIPHRYEGTPDWSDAIAFDAPKEWSVR